MKIKFEIDESMLVNEIEVTIKTRQLNQETTNLINKIKTFNTTSLDSITLQLEDRLQVISFNNLISIQVANAGLVIATNTEEIFYRSSLKNILLRLPKIQFVQVSKNTVLNLQHLEYLEAAFSGNMTAFLSNHQKINVSRKYLPQLKIALGL